MPFQACERLGRVPSMIGEAQDVGWVRDWAERVDQLGLAPLALPLLDLARAFGSMGAHVLLAAEPITRGLVSGPGVGRLATLLDQPKLIGEFGSHLRRGEE